MPNNDKILAQLRAIADSGGPTKPVRSLSRPTSAIGGRSPQQVMEEKVLPFSDEPLAQRGVADAVLGGSPRSAMPSLEDIGSMSPMMGMARPRLDAFKPRQPMPSERRMPELMQKFGGGPHTPPPLPDAPLPMDEASRMGRADEHFPHEMYHATKSDFREFNSPIRAGTYGEGDFGIHVDPQPDVANNAAHIADSSAFDPRNPNSDRMMTDLFPGEKGANIMPLRVRMDKTLHMPKDVGIWRDPASWESKGTLFGGEVMDQTNDPAIMQEILDKAHELTSNFRGTSNALRADPAGLDRSLAWQQDLKTILDRAGYDSISYPNHTEGIGENSYLLLDPRKIRSKFAAFDPNKLHSKDLLASLAAAVGTGAAVSHERDE